MKYAVSALLLVVPAASQLYSDATFDVRNTTDVVYAQGTTCANRRDNSSCTAMDLKLDVYQPVGRKGGAPVPALKPAYILMHGGANSAGDKNESCMQGSAGYFASRGFVSFNINYRLLKDQGLLPPDSAPPTPGPSPPPAKAGWRLVTHVQRSGYDFFPHPQKGLGRSLDSYLGPLRLGAANGSLCVTASGAGAGAATVGPPHAVRVPSLALTLEPCTAGAASQQWALAHWNIAPQRVVHHGSGYCLDIPAATASGKAEAGLPVMAVPCNASSAVQARWQLGLSGALIAQGAKMSVAAEPPQRVQQHQRAVSVSGEWKPGWCSAYPAVRDLKAAVRFVRAHAAEYGIDASRVVVSGGSAGATNAVAAGVTFENDYVTELTAEEDFTLASTHLEQNSSVQCVVSHWASDGEIALAQAHDTRNRTRYGTHNAPIVEFHGNEDGTINISHARAVQAAYARTGVPYELHVLEGCGHAAWCYDGKGACRCPGGTAGYGDAMDALALPFVAKQLGIKLL